jgi:hypothetical protein
VKKLDAMGQGRSVKAAENRYRRRRILSRDKKIYA